ncbi:MAG: hypothetical protein IJ565_05170 [Bacilli bacterium]|nr:hypothetical protein [Bacilli bacterium]
MKCSNCGLINGTTALTCANCGHSLTVENNNAENPVATAFNSVGSNNVETMINQIPASNEVVTQTINKVDMKKEKPKRKKGKKLLVLVFIILIIYLCPKITRFVNDEFNNNEVNITNLKSESETGDKLFVIDDKLDKITGKISTLKKLKDGTIKIYVGNLVLAEKNIGKKFTISDFPLAEGKNDVEITYIIGDKTISEHYYLYNNSLTNLGNLDNSDDDKDNVPNYLEEAYGTNKNLADSDNDGLSDYDEIYLTNTNPTLYASYNNISDSLNDADGDGLSNKDEILYGSNPTIYDTDGDGLSDSLEKQYGTNYSIKDTDGDGLSDYDEITNFNTSPLVKTTTVSGNISRNSDVNLLVNNISTNDIEKVSVVEAGYALLNEDLDGYILPPYKIDTDININSTISFNLSDLNIKEGSNPAIYEIDSNTLEYREVTSYNEGNTISAQVSNTDNLYMLFDKNYLMNEFNSIKTTENVYSTEFVIGDHYMSASLPLFHVVRHFFNMKDVPNESLKIFCFGECDKDYLSGLEKMLEEQYENTIDFEIKKINKLGYFFAKRMYNTSFNILNNICEKEDGLCETPETTNPDSKILQFASVATIFDIIGSDDLGIALLGDNNSQNFVVTRTVQIDDNKDSNHDGISDSITELIIAGKITTKEGYNPFQGLTLDQINKNNDYDKDGIKNNDEISVENIDGVYTLVMKSDPTKKDSDNDGLVDNKDPYPLVSFDSNYVLRNSFKGEPSNVYSLIDEVNESNTLYGKGNIVPYNNGWYVKYVDLDGVEKYSPYNYDFQFNIMYLGAKGGHLYAKDAAKAHDMFFAATGKAFTESDATKELRDDPSVSYYMDKTIDDYIRLAKSTLVDGEKLIFENRNLMPGIDPAHTSDGSSQSTNVFGFLHYSSSDSIGEISNDNGVYRIKLRYFIEDVYDWKNNAYDYGFAGQVEVMYYNQVLIGKAKNFLVHIEYDAEIYYDSNTNEKKVEKFMTPIYQ